MLVERLREAKKLFDRQAADLGVAERRSQLNEVVVAADEKPVDVGRAS